MEILIEGDIGGNTVTQFKGDAIVLPVFRNLFLPHLLRLELNRVLFEQGYGCKFEDCYEAKDLDREMVPAFAAWYYPDCPLDAVHGYILASAYTHSGELMRFGPNSTPDLKPSLEKTMAAILGAAAANQVNTLGIPLLLTRQHCGGREFKREEEAVAVVAEAMIKPLLAHKGSYPSSATIYSHWDDHPEAEEKLAELQRTS